MLCTLRVIVDGLAENTLLFRSPASGGGGGVGGELMLDMLPEGDDPRSRSGVPDRSSSDGVGDLIWGKGPDERAKKVLSWAEAGGNRSFSISDRRLQSRN